MTPPTVEIVFFDSSKQYQDDPGKSMADLVEYLKTTKGYISTHHGPQVEDNTKAYSFVEWQTYEDHKVILDSPTYDVDVIAKVLPALSSVSPPSLKSIHVQFDIDPTKVLDAPVIEIIVLTMKPECKIKKEELKALLAVFRANVDKIALSTAWGQAKEDEDLFVEIVGWESVEAHIQARKSAPEEARKLIASLGELATATVNHIKLVKCI